MSDYFIILWTAINWSESFVHMQSLLSAALHKLNSISLLVLHSTLSATSLSTIINIAITELKQELLKMINSVDTTSESLTEMARSTKCKESSMIAIISKKLKIDDHTVSHAQVSQITSSAEIARYELDSSVSVLSDNNSHSSESVYCKWSAIMFKWNWSKYNEETKIAILSSAILKLNNMLMYEVMKWTINSQRKNWWNTDFDFNSNIHWVCKNLESAAKEWRNNIRDMTEWYNIAYQSCYILKSEAEFANNKIRLWVDETEYKALLKDSVKRAELIWTLHDLFTLQLNSDDEYELSTVYQETIKLVNVNETQLSQIIETSVRSRLTVTLKSLT